MKRVKGVWYIKLYGVWFSCDSIADCFYVLLGV
jgi:hypothetical protein